MQIIPTKHFKHLYLTNYQPPSLFHVSVNIAQLILHFLINTAHPILEMCIDHQSILFQRNLRACLSLPPPRASLYRLRACVSLPPARAPLSTASARASLCRLRVCLSLPSLRVRFRFCICARCSLSAIDRSQFYVQGRPPALLLRTCVSIGIPTLVKGC